MKYIHYSPQERMPVLFQPENVATNVISDRELLLKALSMGQMINEMRTEINNLKQIITTMAQHGWQDESITLNQGIQHIDTPSLHSSDFAEIRKAEYPYIQSSEAEEAEFQDSEVIDNEPVSLAERERSAIVKALDRHHGRRRPAAQELGISERTLYRKIKEYKIEE